MIKKNDREISPFLQNKSSMGILKKNVLAGAHKQFENGKHPEMYLKGLKEHEKA